MVKLRLPTVVVIFISPFFGVYLTALSRIIVMSGTIFVFMLFVTFLKIIAAVS